MEMIIFQTIDNAHIEADAYEDSSHALIEGNQPHETRQPAPRDSDRISATTSNIVPTAIWSLRM